MSDEQIRRAIAIAQEAAIRRAVGEGHAGPAAKALPRPGTLSHRVDVGLRDTRPTAAHVATCARLRPEERPSGSQPTSAGSTLALHGL